MAVLAALGFHLVSVLRGWRALKRLRRHLGKELERLADLGEATADKVEAASDTAELDASLARLASRSPASRSCVRRSTRPSAPSRGLPARVRVAAVDLGTNTTRLLVADVEGGRLEELHRESRITRLGEGVDARRRLLPVPIARVRNVLADYRRTLESLGAERTLAVATSAVRDAENGEAFLGEIEWSYGFVTRLLRGDEEALLTRRGVAPAPGTLVVDIGGGSTELIVDDFHVSLELGSVRHTERFLHGDPPPAGARRLRRGGASAARTARTVSQSGRSAWPEPSRRSPRSTSASNGTTVPACTGTASPVPPRAHSSSGWRR